MYMQIMYMRVCELGCRTIPAMIYTVGERLFRYVRYVLNVELYDKCLLLQVVWNSSVTNFSLHFNNSFLSSSLTFSYLSIRSHLFSNFAFFS